MQANRSKTHQGKRGTRYYTQRYVEVLQKAADQSEAK